MERSELRRSLAGRKPETHGRFRCRGESSVFDYRGAPPARVEYTTKLAPGQKQSVGGAHAGFKADWYRRISYVDDDKEDVLENIHSSYSARPQYTLIGEEQPVAGDNGT